MAKQKATPPKKFSARQKQYKASPGKRKLTGGGATPPARKRRRIGKKALKAAGLPVPSGTKLGTPEFVKLQAEWYGKLKAEGFEDIEWMDKKTGLGQNSDYLKGSLAKGKTWAPERAQFFRLLQNYVTHYHFNERKLDRFIMSRLNDGWTYRAIHVAAKKKYKLRKSLYWVFYRVKELVVHMVQWNREHKHGLLNPANADSWATDALLADFGKFEAPNGLKLDPGWWTDNTSDDWKN
jgi:hypothetical protein